MVVYQIQTLVAARAHLFTRSYTRSCSRDQLTTFILVIVRQFQMIGMVVVILVDTVIFQAC